MAHGSADASRGSDEATLDPNGLSVRGNASDDKVKRPRLIDEHHVIGPYGEDDIEATDERGRRWYHLRPEPRRRADLIGFNYTWWLVMWVLFIVILFFPWGRGWGY